MRRGCLRCQEVAAISRNGLLDCLTHIEGSNVTADSRSRYHLRPETGWLNDPNGMTKVNDTWHVFYQHNPAGPWHDEIAWGHASSLDLATWQHHPIAFSPTEGGPDAFGCWSGCYVPDHDRPTVAYSGVTDASHRSTVCLRHGSDDLVSWSAPVAVAETPEADSISVMRDPFVFDFEGRRWAVLGAGLRDGTPAVLVFNRDDESAWSYEGLLINDHRHVLAEADPADIWECPQLVRTGERWVLIMSLQLQGVLGRVVAVVGDLDVHDGRPVFVPERLNVIDRGNCFYAPQVTIADGRPLMFGWARRDEEDPSVTDQAGCLTLPRRLFLHDAVVSSEVDAIAAAALLGPARSLTPAQQSLAGRCARLVVEGSGAHLRHDDLGEVKLSEGAEIWVDGPVLEVYPRRGVPSTWRSEKPWNLVVLEQSLVTISEVAPWTS